MKFIKKSLVISMALAFPLASIAEPYECTPEELSAYIEQKNISSYVPTPIPTPKEYEKQLAEEANLAGDSSSGETCNTIFTEGFDIDLGSVQDIWGAATGGLAGVVGGSIEKLKEMAQSYSEELKKGICERTSTEYVTEAGKDIIVDQISEETGGSRGQVINFDPQEYAYDQIGEGVGVDGDIINPDDRYNNNRERNAEREVDGYFDQFEDSLF